MYNNHVQRETVLRCYLLGTETFLLAKRLKCHQHPPTHNQIRKFNLYRGSVCLLAPCVYWLCTLYCIDIAWLHLSQHFLSQYLLQKGYKSPGYNDFCVNNEGVASSYRPTDTFSQSVIVCFRGTFHNCLHGISFKEAGCVS